MGSGLRRIDNDTRAVRTLDYRYPDTRMEYNAGGTLKYRSIHLTHDAGTDDADWINFKYTWSEDSDDGLCTRIEGPLDGAVDDIDTLGWGT